MQKHSQMKFPKGIDRSQSQTGSRRFVWSNCPKIFVFEKGVSLHIRHYSINSTSQPVKNNEQMRKVADVYKESLFLRRNLFLLPTGNANKNCINKMTPLLHGWINENAMQDIAL